MNDFLSLTEGQRRIVISQAANKIGLPLQAIEKDFLMTVILQIVYTLPFADNLVFKGGSSLSKVWKLIQRFSEDIDFAIDRNILGFGNDLTKRQIKALRKKSSLFVRDIISP